MKRTIKLNERELKGLIREVIDEIDYKTMSHAYYRADRLDNFEEVQDALRVIEEALNAFQTGGWWNEGGNRCGGGYSSDSKIMMKAFDAFDTLYTFFNRKHKQAQNIARKWEDMDDEATKNMTDDERADFHDENFDWRCIPYGDL